MKVLIPFTKKSLGAHKFNGLSTCNGNGHKHTTISFFILTIIGTGDDGSRSLKPGKTQE